MNKKILNALFTTAVVSAALILPGCGGGGGGGGGGAAVQTYAGTTSAAKIDPSNADSISTNAGVAVKVADDAQNAPVFASISSTGSSQPSVDVLSQRLANIVRDYSATVMPSSYSEAGNCGGTISTPDTPPQSGPWTGTVTFSNYCDSYGGDTLIFNGTMQFSTSDISTAYEFTAQFSNFTVNINGQVTTLNSITVSCTGSSCTFSSDFVGADGKIYRTADLNIYQSPPGTYYGSMTFYHPDYGSVTVSVNAITYGSCGNFPDGGSIDVTDGSSGSASITFASDCTYSGSYTSTGGSGVFSGKTTG